MLTEKELEEKMSTVSNLQAQLAYEKALKEKSKNGVFSGSSSGSYNMRLRNQDMKMLPGQVI